MADEILQRLKETGFIERFTSDPMQNVRILDGALAEINLTKCTLAEFDQGYPGGALFLGYLIQQEGVNFGLCPFYRMWVGGRGARNSCYFNEGKDNQRVYCGASRRKCSNPVEYDAHIEEKLRKLGIPYTAERRDEDAKK